MGDVIEIGTLKKQRQAREIKTHKSGQAWRSDQVYGERLLSARELLGLSSEQLAEASGLAASDISAFEQEGKTPTREQLEAIALATGFPVPFFCQPPFTGFPPLEQTSFRFHMHREDEEGTEPC